MRLHDHSNGLAEAYEHSSKAEMVVKHSLDSDIDKGELMQNVKCYPNFFICSQRNKQNGDDCKMNKRQQPPR